jgi:K+ transporter
VATVLFVTTTLIAISIPFVKGYSFIFGVAFLIFFGFFDGIFWGAALKKVPHGTSLPSLYLLALSDEMPGAWMPLGLGSILYVHPLLLLDTALV